MKILFVEFTSAVSGGGRSLLELIEGLRREHQLILACPRGPLADHATALGIEVLPIPASQLTFRLHPKHTLLGLAATAQSAMRLRRIVRERRPTVVHANSIRAGLFAIPAAWRLTPVVVHCRDALPRGLAGTCVRASVLAGAVQVIAISRHVADNLAGPTWAERGVTVVDNAVDLARFDPGEFPPAQCRESLGIDADLVLSVIAQITPWKGQDLAIRALAELCARGRRAVLLVAGEAKFVSAATRYDNGGFEADLKALVTTLELGDCVRFLGERSDPERILGASDVLLVPSTEEPFGRTIIEAMAMGVPVAATDIGGPPEILSDGVGGLTVAAREPSAWADTIEHLAARAPERRTAARPAAERRFSRERHVAAVLAVYAVATTRSRPSARAA
jgi:glycosyltransferase involved in cell wall biosynthesis